ncbi:hypothetical protein NT2_02_05650 [Caenibius tardaugens NBRC 16725]|uniref:Uncharacterized protein n=1 Tax=Caenibius tardaugens NBRC 16725 TaxID=1219035 RepID=U2Y5S5_9SPHN|nr:hypothetical protein [Caenibius tardaugens]AZI34937.1 hypothetical protein EGO55_02370 [Caenibius tardaugens NBRC 16725]GAD48481.1 hypothetical protein NT2_02_05650 [Caenibius tardaugens NBRC 16725]
MSTPSIFRPVSPPQIIEGAFTEDQHRRMLQIVRDKGPWSLILAQHFKSPDEVVATTSGSVPEGFTPTWDMFLSPVFRGYFAQASTALYPEIEDCFFNSKFLDLVRGYWKADYATPENMLFNIQGPCWGSSNPHLDATRYRGISMHNSPIWLMNTMTKTGLFDHWRAKKAQVISWYYKGKVGGGFTCWPDGPKAQPQQIKAPMWGRAVVVENEMMFHTAESNGPLAQRRPEGLAINSLMSPDPATPGAWQVTTDGAVVQHIPEDEFRFLIHWGADIFSDLAELKRSLDHTDDLTHDQVFDMIITDLKARGEQFEVPTDPLTDQAFIGLLTRVYDPGQPAIFPPEPEEALAA